MKTAIAVDTDAAGCPTPGCGGRLEPYHIAMRPDVPIGGAVVLEAWVAVCIGDESEDPDHANPSCGFTAPLHPRKA